jgi:hypothetical protein
MTDQAISPTPAELVPTIRWTWTARARLVLEFVLLFGAAVVVDHFILSELDVPFPNLLWLPVILLSLEHGLAAAIAAAIAASAIYVWSGLPPAIMSEDMYSYLGRAAGEPVGWTLAALLIGQIRSRQIEHTLEVETELAERIRHSGAVAELCVGLKTRTERLERQIAANAQSSTIEVAESLSGLTDAGFDNVAERLTRFVSVMIGSAEFSIYMVRGNTLRLAFQPVDESRSASDLIVEPDDVLFQAIVRDRRLLSATHAEDRKLLGNRGILVGPLVENNAANRVIGMLGIGGADIVDFPDDLDRRFALTCKEVSRLLSRVVLIDGWQQLAPMRSIDHVELAAASAPVQIDAEAAR